MKKYKIIVFILMFIFSTARIDHCAADEIYLKNGKTIKGLIKKEADSYVEVEMGFGTIKFNKSKIKSIKRSDDEEVCRIEQNWKIEAQERVERHRQYELEQQKQKQIEQRSQQLKRYLAEQQKEKQSEEKFSSIIKKSAQVTEIRCIKKCGGLGVIALLNGKMRVRLLIDTGASSILLRPRIAKELREGTKKAMVEFADGSRSYARRILLDTVKVGDKTAKNVEALFIEDQKGHSGWDGLLGMSYLRNFRFSIDSAGRKLILEDK